MRINEWTDWASPRSYTDTNLSMWDLFNADCFIRLDLDVQILHKHRNTDTSPAGPENRRKNPTDAHWKTKLNTDTLTEIY